MSILKKIFEKILKKTWKKTFKKMLKNFRYFAKILKKLVIYFKYILYKFYKVIIRTMLEQKFKK